jgi:hypothetical protein
MVQNGWVDVDLEHRLRLLRRHWEYAGTDQDIAHEYDADDAVRVRNVRG